MSKDNKPDKKPIALDESIKERPGVFRKSDDAPLTVSRDRPVPPEKSKDE